MRLNPFHPDWYHLHRHIALYLLGRYREAADALECIPVRTPFHDVRLAAAYALDGRDEDAARTMSAVYELAPDLDIDRFADTMNLEHASDREHFRRGMRLAFDLAKHSGAGLAAPSADAQPG